MRAGVIDDMVNDTMNDLDDTSVETDAQVEVDKVMYELTNGQMGTLPSSSKDRSIQSTQPITQTQDNTAELNEMKSMLENKN